MDRTELTALIKKKRPSLTDGSVKSYESMIYNLNKKLFQKDVVDLDDLKDVEKVVDFLKDKPKSSVKTILSALYILTGVDNYRNVMMEASQEYSKEKEKNEMNEKQVNAQISKNELAEKYKELEGSAKLLFKKKSGHSLSELQTLQNYIILGLVSGIYMPPRRLLDFTEMKIKDISEETDNWIDFKKKQIHYNKYKGSGQKGRQSEPLPTALATILKKWIKLNPTNYMLFNIENNKLSPVTLYDRIKKITGTTNNAIRHSFISEKYQPLIDMKASIKKDMSSMGSSTNVLNDYLQKI